MLQQLIDAYCNAVWAAMYAECYEANVGDWTRVYKLEWLIDQYDDSDPCHVFKAQCLLDGHVALVTDPLVAQDDEEVMSEGCIDLDVELCFKESGNPCETFKVMWND